jgi:hypothetical protein
VIAIFAILILTIAIVHLVVAVTVIVELVLSGAHDRRRGAGQQEGRRKNGGRVGPEQRELVQDSEGRPGTEAELSERKRKEGKLVYMAGGKRMRRKAMRKEKERGMTEFWGSNGSERKTKIKRTRQQAGHYLYTWHSYYGMPK